MTFILTTAQVLKESRESSCAVSQGPQETLLPNKTTIESMLFHKLYVIYLLWDPFCIAVTSIWFVLVTEIN